ncbi:hypothetical protein [Actinomadura sp. 3N407]|uniref:hypothetical protein n=1 Tax=Actinomadura sp. 3N407 TaxID=3457423 RepID=UPI003FCE45BC
MEVEHLGILAHSAEGAALYFRAFCQEGFRELGPDDHPDVTLDLIAPARSMPAWDAGDHDSIRVTLAESVRSRRCPRSTPPACSHAPPSTWRWAAAPSPHGAADTSTGAETNRP